MNHRQKTPAKFKNEVDALVHFFILIKGTFCRVEIVMAFQVFTLICEMPSYLPGARARITYHLCLDYCYVSNGDDAQVMIVI